MELLHQAISLFLLLALALLGVIEGASNVCDTSGNGMYYPHDPNCTLSYTAGCVVTKKCLKGFHMTGTNELELNCAFNSTTNGTNWVPDDIQCIACEEPSYGENCNSTMYCSSDPVCSYTSPEGCTDLSPGVECDIANVNLTLNSTYSYATLGVDEAIVIGVSVNLPASDVTVQVAFKGNETILGATTSNYTYEYKINVRNDSAGDYLFEAITTDSRAPPFTSSQKASVAFYTPVNIVSQTWNPSQVVDMTEGDINQTWSCNAEGVDEPNVTWIYAGNEISEFVKETRIYQVKNGSTSELFIRPETGLMVKDSGTYVCRASNEDGRNVYVDVRSLNIIVRSCKYIPEKYVTRSTVIIGICVLAIVLFIVILVLVICGWKARQDLIHRKRKNRTQSTPNQYHHHNPNISHPTALPSAEERTYTAEPTGNQVAKRRKATLPKMKPQPIGPQPHNGRSLERPNTFSDSNAYDDTPPVNFAPRSMNPQINANTTGRPTRHNTEFPTPRSPKFLYPDENYDDLAAPSDTYDDTAPGNTARDYEKSLPVKTMEPFDDVYSDPPPDEVYEELPDDIQSGPRRTNPDAPLPSPPRKPKASTLDRPPIMAPHVNKLPRPSTVVPPATTLTRPPVRAQLPRPSSVVPPAMPVTRPPPNKFKSNKLPPFSAKPTMKPPAPRPTQHINPSFETDDVNNVYDENEYGEGPTYEETMPGIGGDSNDLYNDHI